MNIVTDRIRRAGRCYSPSATNASIFVTIILRRLVGFERAHNAKSTAEGNDCGLLAGHPREMFGSSYSADDFDLQLFSGEGFK